MTNELDFTAENLKEARILSDKTDGDMARVLNRILHAKLAKAPEVFGPTRESGYHYCPYEGCELFHSHRALLVGIEEIK